MAKLQDNRIEPELDRLSKRSTSEEAVGVGVSSETLMWSDYRRGFRSKRRGEQATEAFREADQIDALPWEVNGDDVVYRHEADKFRQLGEILLEPTAPIPVAHGEAISYDAIKTPDKFDAGGIIETLEKSPTTVATGASGKRTRALQQLGILEPALDASVSVQASNSIEKMLSHQMVAVHFAALRLLEKSDNDQLQPGEIARFTNGAARLMDVYQNGCLVLQKLKAKGTQRVLVQYQQVNVGDGGQAVVTGRMGARGVRGRKLKNAK
jgi:hypothetical protein